MTTQPHLGELALRRFRAGELTGDESQDVRQHTDACAHCRSRLRGLDDEQRGFEQAISFERFEAGVTRAARRPKQEESPRRWLFPVMAMAAMVSIAIAAGPLLRVAGQERPLTRTKGGASVDLIVSTGSGPQRHVTAEAPDLLGPGERVMLGFKGGDYRYVAAVAIESDGAVTPLHPENERGTSAALSAPQQIEYLAESLDFTGAGATRIVVVFSNEPLDVSQLTAAAQRAFEEAGRDPAKLPTLGLGEEEFHRTLIRP